MFALKKGEVMVLMVGWVRLRTFGWHDSNEAGLSCRERETENEPETEHENEIYCTEKPL